MLATGTTIWAFQWDEPFASVSVGFDTSTLEVQRGMSMAYFSHNGSDNPWEAINGGITLTAGEPGWANGKVVHELEAYDSDYNPQPLTLDVSFSSPQNVTEPALAPREVLGADSKPAKAFVRMVDATLNGDLQEVMDLTASELAEQMDMAAQDPNMAKSLLTDFASAMMPEKMQIVDTNIDGDRASLSINGENPGCMGPETAKGTVSLVNEQGDWKIALVSFDY